MAKNETKRLAPSIIQADKDAYFSLKKITKYSPADPAYSQAALDAAYNDMLAKQEVEAQALTALQNARDNANDAERLYHNLLLGTKIQVKAQFGTDSNEVQAMGLKKTAEYKKPVRKSKKSS